MHATKNSLIHQEKEDARMQSEKKAAAIQRMKKG
jgi:hypothetical protein